MLAFYQCPRCQSFQVKEHERSVFCTRCELIFYKKCLRILENEAILANEELDGNIDIGTEGTKDLFTDNKDSMLDDKNGLSS